MAFSINEWAQKHLQARLKAKDNAESVKDAKERQAARGEQSVFDTVKDLEAIPSEGAKSGKGVGRPLHTAVCPLCTLVDPLCSYVLL